MKKFNVPTREEVNQTNREIFDNLESSLGFVPNLYATYAHNDTALTDYLALSNRKTTLNAKEKEVVNLVVSQVNDCEYCLAAHTAISKMNGFTDEQILNIRQGEANFDQKLDSLAKFVNNVVVNRSKPSAEATEKLFNAGYTEANLVDIMVAIGDKTISNFIHGATQVPVDFPAAPKLELANR